MPSTRPTSTMAALAPSAPPAAPPAGSGDDPLLDWLRTLDAPAGVRPLDSVPARTEAAAARPRYRRDAPPGHDAVRPRQQEIWSLVRGGDALRWQPGALAAAPAGRAAGRAPARGGTVVKQYAFERLHATTQAREALAALDRRLTPHAAPPGGTGHGLRRLVGERLEPFAEPHVVAGKKVLLLLHGAFASGESMLAGLGHHREGRALLAAAQRRWPLVLTYDHATLGASPLLNALDLAALLRPAPAALDIVAHGRGGLVARWLCESFAEPARPRRVLLVGAPLGGTGLATAPRLRSMVDLLTNVAEALRAAGDLPQAAAHFHAAGGLLRLFSSVTGGTFEGPVLDAALALVPGLDAMGRAGDPAALARLRSGHDRAPVTYRAVTASFEPRDLGWSFVRRFSRPLQRAGDAADECVFDGPSDLLVDTASMTEWSEGCRVAVAHDFGATARVHHFNYFEQPATLRAIRQTFAWD